MEIMDIDVRAYRIKDVSASESRLHFYDAFSWLE